MLRLRKQPAPISIRASGRQRQPAAGLQQRPFADRQPPLVERLQHLALDRLADEEAAAGGVPGDPPAPQPAAGCAHTSAASPTRSANPSRPLAHRAHRLTHVADLRGGIDLGGTKIQTAIVDAGGEVLGEARHPTPTSGGPEDVAEAMAAALREAAEAAGVETERPAGRRRRLARRRRREDRRRLRRPQPARLGGQLPARRDPAARRSGTEVRVGNDVQVATEAEFHLGAGREFQSLIGVFWGTGVGGGLVLDGKPWLGRGAAGEIGHMVVKRGGAKCPCGRKGCMEAYAGRSAMEAEARRQHEEGAEDRPLQADGEARKTAPDQRHLGAGARPRRPPRREADRPRDRGARAPASPPRSTCSTPKR